MPHLVISVRLLLGEYRGQNASGAVEWPPSPLRAFQALAAAIAALAPEREPAESDWASLLWLEALAAPSIVAPHMEAGRAYRTAVPNNDLDILARAWTKETAPSKDASQLKTLKTVQIAHLRDGDTVHYCWPLTGEQEPAARGHEAALQRAARHLTALGWGVDLATADARVMDESEVAALSGERWVPHSAGAANRLRVPRVGSLDDLRRRHAAFLIRIGESGYTPPPPLSAFDRVAYRRAGAPPLRGITAFAVLRTDGNAFRPFDTVRRGLTVAGMLRHAARRAAEASGWEPARVAETILGHGPSAREGDTCRSLRLAYLPLPSIERRGGHGRLVGPIRRVALSSFDEDAAEDLTWAHTAIAGSELLREPDASPVAILSPLWRDDPALQPYLRPAAVWTSVTPVVLPGFDDPGHLRRRAARDGATAEQQRRMLLRLDDRLDGLLRKAIRQAGFPEEVAARADIAARGSGFLAGVDLASRYGIPDHLRRYPRIHVRITWRDERGAPLPIAGPICIGGGRFLGLGLMVGVELESR